MMPSHPRTTFPKRRWKSLTSIRVLVWHSLAGICRTYWFRCMVALAFILPCLGFLSHELHFASDPFFLFISFQHGLQRWLLLAFGSLALAAIWQEEAHASIRAILLVNGVAAFAQWLARTLSLFLLVLGFQLLLSAVACTLAATWLLVPNPSYHAVINASGEFMLLAAQGWCNILVASTVLVCIRLLAMALNHLLLACLLGYTVLLAGMTQPVWLPYFQQGGDTLPIFKGLGLFLASTIPPFWQFDLWLLRDHGTLVSIIPWLVQLTARSVTGLMVLLLASWWVLRLKRT
jgi:hypothetical protein